VLNKIHRHCTGGAFSRLRYMKESFLSVVGIKASILFYNDFFWSLIGNLVRNLCLELRAKTDVEMFALDGKSGL
jgi:hypothetical protein